MIVPPIPSTILLLYEEKDMNHETTARINHRSGYNCAQSVTAAFADEMHLSPIAASKSAPKPRSAGGKCGAYLAGLALLNELKPEAASVFADKFLAENGSTECKVLRGRCNDMVGCAARLVEELMKE